LPIKEDHISWHGNFENYINAKLSPIKRMSERDIVIMPKSLDKPTKAFKILYESEEDLINYFDFKEFNFKTPFLLDEIMAKAVYYILYFKEKSLKNFKIDPHKLEEFTDYKNRTWVDDSKATNVDATINALKRYKDKKIYLILGGVDKGQNFGDLFEFIQNLDIELFIIGKKRDLFIDLAKKYKIPFKDAITLENAVSLIDKKDNLNSIALLSPACASFDMFKNYKDRGEKFKNLIKNV
jgi:UDP-N-acetylmuramoylalanine--D-glutamate ligase